MTTKITKIKNKTPLQILDPDLPFLASEAAIELDNFLFGRDSSLDSVYTLAEMLQNSFEIDQSNGVSCSLTDPATLAILGEAINKSSNQSPVTKVEGLINKACSIANDLLEKNDLENDRKMLEWARAFFVALSRLASAYRKSIFDLRPQHPFRR